MTRHDTPTPRPSTARRGRRGVSLSTRPTVRQLVREALARPVDRNGEPVWAVAGYCGNGDCKTHWHQELVSTLAKLTPIPTRIKCPECGRSLSPRSHAPYALRDHWPVTGENLGCRFHPDTEGVTAGLRRVLLHAPMSASAFARLRPKKKHLGSSTRRKSATYRKKGLR